MEAPLLPRPASVGVGLAAGWHRHVCAGWDVTFFSACSSVASTMFWKFDLSARVAC